MANQSSSAKRRNTGAGKKTTTRPRTSTKASSKTNQRSRKKPSKHNPLQDEIIIYLTLGISILLILSYFGVGGSFSDFFNAVMFGCLGILAYLFPFVLFLGVAFGISNRGNRIARNKIICCVLFLVVLCGFIHLVAYPDVHTKKIFDYFTVCRDSKMGGGVLGAVISCILAKLFGKAGAYVIFVVALLILMTVLTGKLLLKHLTEQSASRLKERRERRMYEEEYDDDDYDDDDYDDPIEEQYRPKRKAKTFTFAQNENQEEVRPAKKKKEKRFGKKEKQNMEEGKPPIGYPDPAMASATVEEPVYETELKNKFRNEPVVMEKEPVVESVQPDKEVEDISADNLNFEITRMEQPEEESSGMAFDETIDPVQEEEITPVSETENYEQVLPEDNIAEVKHHNKKAEHKAKNDTKTEPEEELTIPSVEQTAAKSIEYHFPPMNLLSLPKSTGKGTSNKELKETAIKLQKTLESFGVRVTILNVSCGPTVTRYELQPEQGVKVSKITNLADDIKLNLAAADVRIEAPIPGKAAVGIEVPNKVNTAVYFRELIENNEFTEFKSDLAFAVGKDIGGKTVVTDIAKMPHLLIAGATGSGKSVCINTLIMSIIYKANPNDVKLIMVDPKVVELSVYNGIPHLLIPVVTDPKKASSALNWAVAEMTDRYKKFADLGVRDIKGYNSKIKEIGVSKDPNIQKMPQIVIIVDELADLMMVAPGEVEDAICRLAQMARAAGLHLIIATQRPSVNVITGLIKANVPSRIAFSVSSAIDSRTILDGSGAEKLLGKGDMLFFPSGYPKPVRLQGAFVSDKEVSDVVDYLKEQNAGQPMNNELESKITSVMTGDTATSQTASDKDEYFANAGKFIIEKDKASIGMLQRVFKIGFNRAARIMDQLYEAGVVGPEEGTKPRKVLMSMDEFEQYIDENV